MEKSSYNKEISTSQNPCIIILSSKSLLEGIVKLFWGCLQEKYVCKDVSYIS